MHISLGCKKQSEHHINRFEDALTSAFFGTIKYLPSRVTAELFQALFASKSSSLSQLFCDIKQQDDLIVKMIFWPRIGSVEPDLQIEFSSALTNVTLLIECKWKSGESSDCQLLNQWKALSSKGKINAYHIYLVKDPSKANREIARNLEKAAGLPEWSGRLLLVTWLEILKSIGKLPDSYPSVVKDWKGDMVSMFRRIAIFEFGGFSSLSSILIDDVSERGFWNTAFQGFHKLDKVNVNQIRGKVFFN